MTDLERQLEEEQSNYIRTLRRLDALLAERIAPHEEAIRAARAERDEQADAARFETTERKKQLRAAWLASGGKA